MCMMRISKIKKLKGRHLMDFSKRVNRHHISSGMFVIKLHLKYYYESQAICLDDVALKQSGRWRIAIEHCFYGNRAGISSSHRSLWRDR